MFNNNDVSVQLKKNIDSGLFAKRPRYNNFLTEENRIRQSIHSAKTIAEAKANLTSVQNFQKLYDLSCSGRNKLFSDRFDKVIPYAMMTGLIGGLLVHQIWLMDDPYWGRNKPVYDRFTCPIVLILPPNEVFGKAIFTYYSTLVFTTAGILGACVTGLLGCGVKRLNKNEKQFLSDLETLAKSKLKELEKEISDNFHFSANKLVKVEFLDHLSKLSFANHHQTQTPNNFFKKHTKVTRLVLDHLGDGPIELKQDEDENYMEHSYLEYKR